ncbi:class I SAM-dependent methyltransferase [Myxococcota bacterium]|nr:class I SAM-dependent methyltransferase [Myxococcota bacterium]
MQPDGPTHWTETFFDGAWLDVQRSIHPPELSQQQAEDLCELLELEAGDRVLDAPCGEGRLSLALAELGLEATGVDRCVPLLEDARAAARVRDLPCRFEELDLREVGRLFDPGGEQPPFDAALCIWGSFGYFGDGGVHAFAEGGGGGDLAFARAVASVLRPGGRFVIDCPGLEMLMARYQTRGWFDGGGVRVLEQRAWDPLEGVMHVEWTLVKGGEEGPAEVSIRHSAMRIYSAPELARLLSKAGFRGFDLCSDLAGGEWKPGDRMVMIATR